MGYSAQQNTTQAPKHNLKVQIHLDSFYILHLMPLVPKI